VYHIDTTSATINRYRLILLAPIVLLFSSLALWAVPLPGVEWYTSNAEVIAVVRNLSREEVANFPSGHGQQRLLVVETLKGVCTQQYFVVPERKLGLRQMAILLVPYTPPPFYAPYL